MVKLQQIIEDLQSDTLNTDLPKIRVGDLIKLGIYISEGNKQRIQSFEGIIIAQHKAGANSTITVRKILQGFAIERIFLLHTPYLAHIQILRRFLVSRSKLYYLRQYTGKDTRLKEIFGPLPTGWIKKEIAETAESEESDY